MFVQAMTVFSLHIFSREGKCIYSESWHGQAVKTAEKEHDLSLLFGLLFSLRTFVDKITPTQFVINIHYMSPHLLSRRLDDVEHEVLRTFSTDSYKLHYLEPPTGWRFAIKTDPNVPSCVPTLQKIYSEFVKQAVNYEPGKEAKLQKFRGEVDKIIRALEFFK